MGPLRSVDFGLSAIAQQCVAAFGLCAPQRGFYSAGTHHTPETPMLNLRPLDPAFSIEQQLQGTSAPVVLVNLFTVAEADVPALMTAWEKDATWMKQQPGFLSTQLHRAIGGSHMFMNYAVWESVEHFRAAFTHPDFVGALAAYPSSAFAQPHLFAKVAVPNLCAA
jgi:heme-degrading monooxygenase HmoA